MGKVTILTSATLTCTSAPAELRCIGDQYRTPCRGESSRTRRHRPRPARGHGARRPRRRRGAGAQAGRVADARRGQGPVAPRQAHRRSRRQERAGQAAGPGRQGGRPDRRVPARNLRTVGDRARRLRGGQPAADLRADHRVGSGRPAGADRRPRHQLPVPDRRAVGHRLPRPPAGRAAEPGRRLRRRVDVRAARYRRRAL